MTAHDRTETLRKDRKRFFWKIEGEVLFSDAFKEIARDGQTLMTYLLILARQSFPPNRKERLRMEKAGTWPPKDSSFSFPLREAPYHGLTEKGLAAGLRRLHEVGIIDRIRAGSALKGDFALYVLSGRWRGFGKPTFKAIPWLKANSMGTRGEGGKFIRQRGRKFLVAAISAASNDALTANSAATPSPIAAKTAVNKPPKGRPIAAKTAVLLSSPSLDVDSKGTKRKVWTQDSRPQGIAVATRCNYNPELSFWAEDEALVHSFGSEATQ